MDNVKQMIAAARTLLEVAETLMESPVPAALIAVPEQPKSKSAERPHKPEHSGAAGHRYTCADCQEKFKSGASLMDAVCPKCGSLNIEKRANKNAFN